MIKKISHVIIWCSDLDNTIKWYTEKLDFHAAGEDWTQIGKGPLPYYIVKDIEAVKIWLEKKSIKVNEIQQVGDSPKHTWFWDYEGNVLGFVQY